ncbi:NAD-dependent epimerase/dehydratase family protein [Altererythrobacter soli]|uniref:NAD-dependent epimerase/dehydratase family protein n=1 Tax=Croceibacterium soli TaxID=1739690 RepID=A0A6I4URX8_9SPHN|nr:NAD(P)-dependent oxidoreductase [Croceibacterium soli]MXP41662.1 NAD-dependent epimerase/dehydratase family protein [Croceibacterium soli]
MTIAVTGATGFVGCALLELAAGQGQEIRALTRRRQPKMPGVEWVPGDLHDRKALVRLVSKAEAVIHVAGVVNTPDPTGFHLGNIEGTMAVVEAAVAARVPRFVFVSSLAAREPQLSEYGASKRHAEKLVSASGLDWTIVRPPAIYGPRDREMLELFKLAKWGVVPMPPQGRASLIHVEDLARLLLALVPSREDVTRQVFEPDDGKHDGWSHRELAKAIGWALGRRPWVPHLSKPMLERVARLDKALRGDKAKLTPDRVGYMTHPDWVCTPRMRPPTGLWMPEVATLDGLRSTAKWYREKGWL